MSESTVSRTLKQMAWNRKMTIRIAQQRNQSLRGKGRRDERSRIRAFKTGDDDLGGLINDQLATFSTLMIQWKSLIVNDLALESNAVKYYFLNSAPDILSSFHR